MVRTAEPVPPRLVLVGATGALGSVLLELIGDGAFPYGELLLCASPRSDGRRVLVGGVPHEVRHTKASEAAPDDLVLLCAGDKVSRQWARTAAAAGALVIDLSGAFHRDPDVPLIVPEINGHLLRHGPPGGVVACPAPMTVAVARLLHRVQEVYGVRQVVVSTYQAAAGLGRQAVEELLEGTELALQDPDAEPPAQAFPQPLAFNVVPAVGALLHSHFSTEEQRLARETRRLLARPCLNITATCVNVPVIGGHAAAVFVEAEVPVPRRELVSHLAALPRVRVHDHPTPDAIPTPLTAAATDPDTLHVGRVRITPHDPRALWLWFTFDSLRTTAALNALHVARLALAAWGLSRRA